MFSTLLGNKSIFCCPFCYYRVIECISATLLWNSWPHINRSLSCVRAISDLWKWLWMARWPKWSRGQEENAGHVIRTVLSLLQELQHVCFWLIFASSSAGQEAGCELPHTPDSAHLFFLHLWPRKSSSVAVAIFYCNTYTEKTENLG